MDYKKTLDIPFTEFSMKANLSTNSKKFIDFWIDKEIYKKRQSKNSSSPDFIIHDGPPYANGSIHIGHALNKILKDFIVRWKSLEGFKVDFVPGWDCHGLPIENQIEKTNKDKYNQLTKEEKRKLCKNYSEEQINSQVLQYRQLGLFIDFKKKYKTLDENYIASELDVFVELCKKDLIYWDLKPVFWSWSSKTTLAESEIIYQTVKEESIYWFFEITNDNKFKNSKLLIWTTTPYTLEANLAVAISPTKSYVLFEHKNNKYICIKTLYSSLIEKFSWNDSHIIEEFLGQELVGNVYLNSITQETNPILAADFVEDNSGTGLVHIAPGFGADDYKLALKNNINVYCSIDGGGYFVKENKFNKLTGHFYKDGSLIIIEYLKNINQLVHVEEIEHNVGHDWRTKKPTLFRATKQWFLNIKKIKKQLNQSLNDLESSPKWLSQKLKEIVLQREEWCLSRQRCWGLFIPIIFADGEPIMDIEQIKHACSIIKKEGIDSWLNKEAKYFLKTNHKFEGVELTKSTDILDVWFDSGCSFLSLPVKNSQADIYLEGFDQLRGWFNSSSIISTVYQSKLPFKHLIGHGFVLDGNGNKMSKSLGNVVDPLEIVNTHGSDILRLWVGQTNYFEDIRFNKDSFENTISQYRKIRNVLFKYSLSVLKQYQINLNLLNNLTSPENQYIYSLFVKEFNQALSEIKIFNFSKALQTLLNFINLYSSWYLEISKDIIYCEDISNTNKQETLTIVYTILQNSLIFFSIFIPQTAEETYSFLNKENKQESIFLESWPKSLSTQYSVDENHWKNIFNVKEKIYSKIEEAKNNKIINLINESKVIISKNLIQNISTTELKKYLNISEILIVEDKDDFLEIYKTELPKCLRCKKHHNSSMSNHELCNRCCLFMKNFNQE